MADSATPARPTSGAGRGAWTILRVRGVPVRVDISWVVIAGLVIWAFARQLSELLGDRGTVVVVATSVAVTLLFFASVLAHELGHTLASLERGVPVLGIKLFMLGGVTESSREASSARDEFVIVGIGPFVSLVLAAACGLIYTLVRGSQPYGAIFGYLAWLNLALAAFNIVPGYPLDGGRLLRSVLWAITGRPHQATRWAARIGQGFALLLLAGALYGLTGGPVPSGPAPLRTAALLVASNPIWNGLIGLFLLRGASEAHQRARLREQLVGRRVRQVMGSVPPVLPADLTLDAALERLQERPSLLWPVGEPLSGVVRLADVDTVSQHRWPTTRVADLARPAGDVAVDADTPLDAALTRLRSAPGHMLIVTDGGRPVGLLTLSLVAGIGD